MCVLRCLATLSDRENVTPQMSHILAFGPICLTTCPCCRNPFWNCACCFHGTGETVLHTDHPSPATRRHNAFNHSNVLTIPMSCLYQLIRHLLISHKKVFFLRLGIHSLGQPKALSSICMQQGVTLRLARWPMATKISVWATNLQAALAQMDQRIFKCYAYILYWANNEKFCLGQLPTISTSPKRTLNKNT